MNRNGANFFSIATIVVLTGGLCLCGAPAKAEQLDAKMQPQGLGAVGVYDLRRIDPNLTGKGVRIALISRSITYIDGEPQNDYRPNSNHQCFGSNQFIFHDQGIYPSGVSAHSTSICSILLGEDENAFNPELGEIYYQGVSPEVELEVYEFWHFLSNNVFSQLPPEADIITAGIGSQFEDWWTRGLDSLAQREGLIVIAGIGNGLDAHDPPLYPAASANAIGVGVVDSVKSEDLEISLKNFALAYPQHSTWGPTVDQRCKPDIVAPGNCLVAEPNRTGQYKPAGNWTSFSTPVVAGTAALLLQKAKEYPELSPMFSSNAKNCLIKAILLNSATKLPFWHKGNISTEDDHTVPLDYLQGAGMLDAKSAYEHLIAGPNKPGDVSNIGWDLNQTPQERTFAKLYRLSVNEASDSFLSATLSWNKHYQNEYPFEPEPEKDVNLRLEVWAVNPEKPDDHYLLDYSDSDNDNLEHIYTRLDPNYTSYEIIVSDNNMNTPEQILPIQSYAIAWNVSSAEDEDSILRYDLNADGIVDNLDLYSLLENWITSIKQTETYFIGDINADGIFNANDFQALTDNMNRRTDWYIETQPE